MQATGNVPCAVGERCLNSPTYAGDSRAKCCLCRYSPTHEGRGYILSYWRSAVSKSDLHPQAVAEKKQQHRERLARQRQARRDKDKTRQKLLKKAARAEQSTNREIIRATVNSGRLRQDGDHLALDCIVLDTKLQSRRSHPLVDLDELHKVRAQAQARGQLMGALVLRTKSDIGVVAMAEGDFAKLLRLIRQHQQEEEPPQRDPYALQS